MSKSQAIHIWKTPGFDEIFEEYQFIAELEKQSVSDLTKEMITKKVEERRKDPAFVKYANLKRELKKQQEALQKSKKSRL